MGISGPPGPLISLGGSMKYRRTRAEYWGKRCNGFTLVETVVTLFVVVLIVAISAPRMAEAHRKAALRGVTATVVTQMWRARSEAISTGQATALVFDRLPEEGWRCRVVQDGDADGVRRSDIDAGIDVVIGRVLEMKIGRAGFGILEGQSVPNPSGGGLLGGDLRDPIRAGSGDVLTFTAEGTATSSTLYFSDQHRMMRAIRIFGITGRMRTLAWQVGWDEWRIARR